MSMCLLLQLRIPSKAAFKLRPRDVIVNLKKKHICVGIKGQPPILDDELEHEIKIEETTWLLEDGKIFLINIEKVKIIYKLLSYLCFPKSLITTYSLKLLYSSFSFLYYLKNKNIILGKSITRQCIALLMNIVKF